MADDLRALVRPPSEAAFSHKGRRLLLLASLFLMTGAAAPLTAPIVLRSPIQCRVGETCQIQQYFDHDPGPAAKDYACGGETYEGHDGTDFRVPDMAAVARGVPVLAAAAGVVKGGRDGMEDISVARIGKAAIAGRECGNGVVIAHPGGWETQYCHMRKGSVRVKVGQAVAAGEPLGLVGMSGDAEFPHVHLSVRRAGEKIDPFAYGAAPGACEAGTSLWTAEARTQFSYQSPAVLNLGLAAGPVNADAVEAGAVTPAGPGGAAMVAWARLIGLKKQDEISIQLIAPGGAALAANRSGALDHDKAQYLIFSGIRRPPGGWRTGRYAGAVSVSRGGRVVLARTFELSL